MVLVAVATLVVGTGVVTPEPADAAARTSVDVRASHPRLLVTDESAFADIKANSSTDSVTARLMKQVLSSADYQLTQPVVGYDFQDSTRMTTTAKALVDRAYSLSLAWRLTGDKKYMERLWSNLESAARFPNWNPGMFLDTAEIANAFAVSYDWGYSYWSESRRATLRNAILDKALRPALPLYSAPPGDPESWVTASHNRNVVVNSGLGLASLAIITEDTSGDARRVLDFAMDSIKNGLRGYLADGSYAEGPMYWEYATDYSTLFLNALSSSTGSTHGLVDIGGLTRSGAFVRDLMTPSGDYFTYASSDAVVYPAMGFSGLARLTGDRELEAVSAGMDTSRRAAQRLVWRDPTVAPITAPDQSRPRVAVYGDAGIATVRGDSVDAGATFAALRYGGDPTVGHRQSDAGDVMIAVGGITWAEQLGLDRTSYTALANGAPVSSRWSYYRNRIEGHNTLTLDRDSMNDYRDAPGGTLVSSGSGRFGAYAVADVSASRGAPVGTWLRGIRVLSSIRQVVLQDEVAVASGATARWSLHTSAGVEITQSGRSALLYKDGQRLLVELSAADSVRFRATPAVPSPISPSPTQDANTAITKLVADVPGGSRQSITVTMTLLPPTADPGSRVGEVRALEAWGSLPTQSTGLSRLTVDGAQVEDFSPERRSYTHYRDPALPQPIVGARDARGNAVAVAAVPGTPGSYLVGGSPNGDSGVLLSILPERTTITAASATATTRGSVGAVFDGNESTGWAATGAQHIDLTLRGSVELHRLDILWTANSTRRIDYRILVLSGTTWSTAASGSHRSVSGWSTNTFATPQSTSKIRIEVLGDPGGDRTSTIREVEVSGFRESPVPPNLAPGAWGVTVAPLPTSIATEEWIPLNATATGGAAGASFEAVSGDRTVVATEARAAIGVAPGTAPVGVYARVGDWEYPSQRAEVAVRPSHSLSIRATKDTFVEGGASSDRNFGRADRLDVKAASPATPPDGTRVRTSLIAFDLSGIDPERIASAVLVLTGSIADNASGDAVRVDAYQVDGMWTDKNATYQNRPSLGAPIGSMVTTRQRGESRLDLTAVLRELSHETLRDFDLALGGNVPADPTLMARFGSSESLDPPRIEVRLSPVSQAIEKSTASGTLRGTSAATYDNSISSGWAARGGASATWTLPQSTLIRTIRTDWSPDSSRKVTFRVRTSLDGNTWNDAGSFTYSGAAGSADYQLRYAYNARHVRLELISAVPTWQATLREVDLLSPGAAPAEVPTPLFADATVAAPPKLSVHQAGSITTRITDLLGTPVQNVAVTHRSDKPEIVSVNASGRVLAQAAGTATVTTTISQGTLSRTFTNMILVSRSDLVTVAPSADTFVEGGASANTVFGSRARLDVKAQSPGSPADGTRVRHAFLSFNLSGIDPLSITSATLSLNGALIDDPSIPEAVVHVYEVTDDWNETATTYTNRPGLGKLLTSFKITRESGAREIDLTGYLRQLSAAGMGTVAIGLGGSVPRTPESLLARFDSREAGEALAPKLVIQRAVTGIGIASTAATATSRGTAASTVDGNENTGWAADGDQSITWRLTQPSSVGSVRLLWTANNSRYVKYELLGSADGKQWTKLHDGDYRGASGWQTIYLPRPAAVSLIRMMVHGDPQGHRQTTLREIVVMSDATSTG
ncbi:CBM96 family carbohydrate-binding protein [Microbacterium oleivorans]|uniref:DNRLRE domain-containing protein n=1 Tax=Microbacterium oleivorans TaxID=273677 RepID=A0A7D5EXQ8_9MICO|nr:DNRLRE domain-containing protein [Microbacterium oleivorans]QLD12264.1 DNRLRE domain-containing protein [Microbacterium oleivorans]